MNYEVILYTSVIIGILIVLFAFIFNISAAKNIRKSTKEMIELQEKLKVGCKVVCAGGIFGTVKAISDDKIQVEISEGTVITILKYSIQGIC